jgi:hypothetical protein
MVWAAYFGCALLAISITEKKFLLSSRTTLPEQAFLFFLDPSKMELAINSVKVIHAWNSNRHLTGIPAHVKELADLHELKLEQSRLAQLIYKKVMNGLTEYFDAQQIGGGEMTKAPMKEMIATVCQENVEHLTERFEQKLHNFADPFKGSLAGNGRPKRQPRAWIDSRLKRLQGD